jgi:hypothetical protein
MSKIQQLADRIGCIDFDNVQPFKLSDGVYVANPEKFVYGHFSALTLSVTAKSRIKRDVTTYKPYYDRLVQVLDILEKQNENND